MKLRNFFASWILASICSTVCFGYGINIVQPTTTTVPCGTAYQVVAVGFPTGPEDMSNPRITIYKNNVLFASGNGTSLSVPSVDLTPNSTTTYSAQLFVGAGSGVVASTTKSFTVSGNQAPVGTLDVWPSTSWKRGDLFVVQGRIKDPELGLDGLTVNVLIDNLDVGAAVIFANDLNATGYKYELDFRPTTLSEGPHTLVIKAVDKTGAVAVISTKNISVQNANPTGKLEIVDANGVPFQLVNNGYSISKGSQFYIRISASDPEGKLKEVLSRFTRPNSSVMVSDGGPVVRGDNFNGSRDFGPYLADVAGSWSVWGHAYDTSAASWGSVTPWTGQDYGWVSFLNTVMTVTNAPIVTVDPAGAVPLTQGGTIVFNSSALDAGGGLTNHKFEYCNPLGVWGSGATLGGLGDWTFPACAQSRHSVSFTPLNSGTYKIKWSATGSGGTGVTNTYDVVVNADANSDGMSDAWVVSQSLNLTSSPGSLGDPDGDGFTNVAEANLGTSPTQAGAQPAYSLPAEWSYLTSGIASSTKAIGTTKGSFSVDKGGSAAYSIPIAITPGTAGMQPQFTLSYSSNGGNGIAGLGWGLSGLSSISRGPRTKASDGYIRGVDFTNSDAFYLDGQRLVPVADLVGTVGSNGANGTEYRTEMDSFSRVVSYGTAGNGPDWFRVWTKAGLIIEFGHTAGSQLNPGGGATALSWQVSKISDTVGNYMTFSYVEDTVNGYQLIDRVDYTGNAGMTIIPYASVRFEYEDRSDIRSSYMRGLKISSLKRLKRIKSFYGETVVRTYELAYTALNAPTLTSPSTLTSITEYGKDGSSYNPLLFTYDAPTLGALWESYSVSGLDLRATPYFQLAQQGDPTGAGFMDLNGDGFPDLVRKRLDNNSVYANDAYLNSATGWTLSTSMQLPGVMALAWVGRQDAGARFCDVDGDGFADALFSCYNKFNTIDSYLNHNNGGTSWSDDPNSKIPASETYISRHNWNDAGRRLVDINSDGLPDLLWRTKDDAGVVNTGCLLNNYANAVSASASRWVRDDRWAPPFSIIEEVSGGAQFFDVNGDGLPDLVMHSIHDASGNSLDLGVAINSPTGWTQFASGTSTMGATYATKKAVLGTLGKYLPPVILSRDSVGRVGTPIGSEVVDLNGDGLTDVLINNPFLGNSEGTAAAWLNTGDGWISSSNFTPSNVVLMGVSGDVTRSVGAVVADVNGDGLPDLLRAGAGTAKLCYLNTGNGWENTSSESYFYQLPITVTNTDISVPTGFQIIDMNGDGAMDVISNTDLYYNKTKMTAGKLIKVENGLGVKVRVAYSPLNDRNASTAIYVKGTGSVYPVREVAGPFWAVRQVDNDDGAGDKYSLKYGYGELRSHAVYGSLGFGWMSVKDLRNNITSTTEFSQTYPYIGMVEASTTKTGTGGLISESAAIFATKSLNAGKTKFIYASSTTQKSYELNGALTSFTLTEPVDADFDAYGNALKVTVYKDPAKTYFQTTISTFDNTITAATTTSGNWFLGRLRRSAVTSGMPSPNLADPRFNNVTRTSAFDYNSTTGLLATETVEPDQAASVDNLTVVKTYGYDGFGNKTSVTLSGGGLSGVNVRTTTTSYNPSTAGSIDTTGVNGRFPVSTANAVGHSEYYAYDHAMGLVTKVRGPNGKDTSTAYDGFGQTISEQRPDGTASLVTYKWAPSGLAGNPKYLVLSETRTALSGGTLCAPPSVSFFDSFGRVVASYGVNGGDIFGNLRIVGGLVEYDSYGREYRKSLPFVYGTAPRFWNTNWSFDVLGRPTEIRTANEDSPSGYVSATIQYWGTTPNKLETLTTNPKGQVEKIEKNIVGQVVLRTNNAGTSLANEKGMVGYRYDPLGQIVDTMVYSSATTFTTTSFYYDLRGRKTSMSDVDKGTWTYKYNAAGELIEQNNSSTQKVTMNYDKLGRLVLREEVEGRTTWVYDDGNGAPQSWKGKLAKVSVERLNASVDFSSGFQEVYKYDGFGRQISVAKTINAAVYTTQQTYDSVGRPEVLTYPNLFAVKNVYDQLGFLRKVVSDSNPIYTTDVPKGFVFWRADSFSLSGQVDASTLGNGVTYDRVISESTGRVGTIVVGQGTLSNALYHQYTYDSVGNVALRRDWANNRFESFAYDGLNRLTSYSVQDGATVSTNFDALGNITYKSDVGTYSYDTTKIHAFTNTTNNSYRITGYDARGNALGEVSPTQTKSFEWTSFDQLKKISTNPSLYATFEFGANHERVRQVSTVNSTETIYVGAHYEKVVRSGLVEEQSYVMTPLGRTAVRTGRSDLSGEVRFLHQDALGSVMAVTDERGRVEKRFSYDPWGKQTQTLDLRVKTGGAVNRGFTDHEMLKDFSLIHMNGRVYDPVLGRFLSADPFVQGAGDSQSFNRYSYLSNNPVNGTDPSGYFSLKEILPAIVAVVVAAIVIVAIVTSAGTAWTGLASNAGFFTKLGYGLSHGTWLLGAISGGAGGFASGFSGSLLNGGSIGDAFKAGAVGAAFGAASAAAAFGIGQFFDKFVGNSFLDWGGRALAHGGAQGGLAELQGGEFRHGFLSAAFASAASPAIGKYFPKPAQIAQRTAAASIVGGTASSLGGGKFANGAVTGAFTHLFNAEVENIQKRSLKTLVMIEGELAKHSAVNGGTVSVEKAWTDASMDINYEIKDSGGVVDVRVFTDEKDLKWIVNEYGKNYDRIILSTHGDRDLVYLGSTLTDNGMKTEGYVLDMVSKENATKISFHHCQTRIETTSWSKGVFDLRNRYDMPAMSVRQISFKYGYEHD